MTPKTAIEFERRVAETIKQLNYRVKTDPLQSSEHSTWQDRISSWLTKPPPDLQGPDMLVANGEKVVLVEAIAYQSSSGLLFRLGTTRTILGPRPLSAFRMMRIRRSH